MDRALVERARDGDQEAYQALARSSARRLFLIAQRILRDSDAAEDAVQQTLVTMWRELPRLREPDNFDAWTYRIVTRNAVAEAKRQKRHRSAVQIMHIEPASADGSAAVEARDAIDHAFERLSPEHRAVVVLRYYADMPIKEIAYAMGIPNGTVASRLHRAMADMRRAISDEPPGPTGTTGGDGKMLAEGTTR